MTYFESNRKEDCCGCRACQNICPKDALHLVIDEEGFFYPVKNEKCIDCRLCEKVCPYNLINVSKEEEKQASLSADYPLAFATYAREERIGSSSGGIFYVLAKHIIDKGGFVYGAAFDESFQLYHIAARTIEELQPIRGSKYLQSNIGVTFREIKKLLLVGEYVFFSGTPCQVAGLKSYLQKEYDRLLTADLICHGTPSQWMFDQHKAYLEQKYGGMLSSYHFRNEEGWGGCEIIDFTNPKNGKTKHVINATYELSPYQYSFINSYTYRLSCYECLFAKVPRQGDITLGDFWGVKQVFPNIDTKKGVSAILINTPKGNEVWKQVKMYTEFEQTDYMAIAVRNKNLVTFTKKPVIREKVFEMIRERGYADVAMKEFRHPNHRKIFVKEWLKQQYFFYPLLRIFRILRGIK